VDTRRSADVDADEPSRTSMRAARLSSLVMPAHVAVAAHVDEPSRTSMRAARLSSLVMPAHVAVAAHVDDRPRRAAVTPDARVRVYVFV
jgi:hypothetical protein